MAGFNDEIEQEIERQDLTQDPPEFEPQRQYYFIKKARERVRELSEQLGRPLYACTVNMGCQVNTEREIKKSPKIRAFCFDGKNGAEKLRQFRGNFKALTSGLHS